MLYIKSKMPFIHDWFVISCISVIESIILISLASTYNISKLFLNEYLMSKHHLMPGAFSQSQLSKRGLPETASKRPKENI